MEFTIEHRDQIEHIEAADRQEAEDIARERFESSHIWVHEGHRDIQIFTDVKVEVELDEAPEVTLIEKNDRGRYYSDKHEFGPIDELIWFGIAPGHEFYGNGKAEEVIVRVVDFDDNEWHHCDVAQSFDELSRV